MNWIMENFSGKRIAIVGCQRGIGRSLAYALSAAGAELLLADQHDEVSDVAAEISKTGGFVKWTRADGGDPEACAQALGDLWGDGPLDGLCYLPRGRQPRAFSELTYEGWNNDLNTALAGACFAARAAAPLLATSARSGGSPFILFVSSILSKFIGRESVGYHVAKAGLDQLTRYLAVEFGPQGIRVNAVQLGFMVSEDYEARYWSDENRSYRETSEILHPLRRVGFSQDFIGPALFLASSRAAFITGQILCVDGGLSVHDHSTLFNSARSALEGSK